MVRKLPAVDKRLDGSCCHTTNAVQGINTFIHYYVVSSYIPIFLELTSAWVDIEEITRETVREIGYVHSDMGFAGGSDEI